MCSVCNLSLSPATVSSISDQGELTHMHSATKSLGAANRGCPFSFLTVTYPACTVCPFPCRIIWAGLWCLQSACPSVASRAGPWTGNTHQESQRQKQDATLPLPLLPSPAGALSHQRAQGTTLPHLYFLFIWAIKGKKQDGVFRLNDVYARYVPAGGLNKAKGY